jgi:hypothetical protein
MSKKQLLGSLYRQMAMVAQETEDRMGRCKEISVSLAQVECMVKMQKDLASTIKALESAKESW